MGHPASRTSASPAHWNTSSHVKPARTLLKGSASQCSFTRGSTPPRKPRPSVSKTTRAGRESTLVHLVQRHVHPARDHSWIRGAADQPSHQVAGGKLAQRHQRAEIAEVNVGSGLPSMRATVLHRSLPAGTPPARAAAPSRPNAARRARALAQSPNAKISGSRVVCGVDVTTSWLPD